MHLRALLNEEENKSVVVAAFYHYSVEVLLEVVCIVVPLASYLLQGYLVHPLHDSLAAGFVPTVVEEADCGGRIPVDGAHLFNTVY